MELETDFEKSTIPRRSFLRVAILGLGGVVAVGTAGYSLMGFEQSNVSATRYGKLLVLSPSEADILYHFSEASLPSGNGFPTVEEAAVVNRLDEELYFISKDIRDDFTLAINVLQYLPLTQGYFSRFEKMSLEQRREFLVKTQHTQSNTIRAVVNAIRMVTNLVYYGHESTWTAMQFDGSFARMAPQLSEQRQFYIQQTNSAIATESQQLPKLS